VICYNANLHTIGTTLLGDYWLILHGGIHSEPVAPLLDIYSRTDGSYLYSFELPYRSGHIASGEDFLYALHTIEGESHLVMYDIEQIINED